MDGTSLVNKANTWQSNDEWSFTPQGAMIYINNTTKNTVLGTAFGNQVIEEPFVKDEPGQLWEKGPVNEEGYFTIKNPMSSKSITAISRSSLKTKGDHKNNNHLMRSITNTLLKTRLVCSNSNVANNKYRHSSYNTILLYRGILSKVVF